MPTCHEMKSGEVYTCPDCGLELQVTQECHEAGKAADDCGCHPGEAPSAETCTLSCCGKPLVKKGG